MSFNWASTEAGAKIVDFSSEVVGCEAANVQSADHSSIWMSRNDSLPQWLCLSLADVFTTEDLVLRTLGWHCWHPDTANNPKTVNIHVSCDGQKFRVWDTLHAPMLLGTQLFTTAAINTAIYKYIAFEILETHGGSQTYMNRIFLYTDEVPPSPAPRHLHARSSSGNSTFQSAFSARKAKGCLSPHQESDEDECVESRLQFGGDDSFDAVLRQHASSPAGAGAGAGGGNPFEANPFDDALLDASPSPDAFFERAMGSAGRRVESPVAIGMFSEHPRSKEKAGAGKNLRLAMESLPPVPAATNVQAVALAARVAKLESTSAEILQQLHTLQELPQGPGRAAQPLEPAVAVPPAVLAALQEMGRTVSQALTRVEQRHSAFIEGFSMAAGRSLYSETVYSPETPAVRMKLPPPPNLEQLRSSCGVRVHVGAEKPQPQQKAISRKVKATPSSASYSNTRGVPAASGRTAQSDHDVALLALQLSVAVHRRRRKEEELRSLIDQGHAQASRREADSRIKRNGRGSGSASGKIRLTQTRWW